MRKTILYAVSVCGLIAAPVSAAPLSSSLALKSPDAQTATTVQWRRAHGARWIGPTAGFAAGVAIGSTFAPRYYDDYGYGAYAYAPGYAYAPPRRYGTGCTGEESADSAYPS